VFEKSGFCEPRPEGLKFAHIFRPTFPLQTNSVSFEVTAEMLKARAKK
jgi:hypothetical protein